jgi:hypothetical protein
MRRDWLTKLNYKDIGLASLGTNPGASPPRTREFALAKPASRSSLDSLGARELESVMPQRLDPPAAIYNNHMPITRSES